MALIHYLTASDILLINLINWFEEQLAEICSGSVLEHNNIESNLIASIGKNFIMFC